MAWTWHGARQKARGDRVHAAIGVRVAERDLSASSKPTSLLGFPHTDQVRVRFHRMADYPNRLPPRRFHLLGVPKAD